MRMHKTVRLNGVNHEIDWRKSPVSLLAWNRRPSISIG